MIWKTKVCHKAPHSERFLPYNIPVKRTKYKLSSLLRIFLLAIVGATPQKYTHQREQTNRAENNIEISNHKTFFILERVKLYQPGLPRRRLLEHKTKPSKPRRVREVLQSARC